MSRLKSRPMATPLSPPCLSRPLRLVFMGTPEFAVPALQALLESEDEVVGVVCQPDKPAGRRMALHAPPVKDCARGYAIPVFQPQKIRTPEALAHFQSWQPDLIVVAAYGKMLPTTILDLPPAGCINIHASLLPKYRGAAPIQWAIARGETHSGVTIMQVSEQMDAGPILWQQSLALTPDETGQSLHDRLAELGARALLEALSLWKRGRLAATAQDEHAATYAPLLKKEDGEIDWTRPAVSIEQRIRAFYPWPSAYTWLDGKRLKVLTARLSTHEASTRAVPGTIIARQADSLSVATGQGGLTLDTLQLEGKKALPVAAFLAGHDLKSGARLGR